ncbi:MAG: hypothetical protein MZW92_00715 [Comamonadaceae bacterium]|nr:hypothetical protein [Comamonadaceae bacterium]
MKQAVADVETELDKVDKYLPKRVTTPVAQGYRPELDASHELDAKRGQYYQSLIGVLRWICELGRLDILVAVSMLSRYVVSPEGWTSATAVPYLCLSQASYTVEDGI